MSVSSDRNYIKKRHHVLCDGKKKIGVVVELLPVVFVTQNTAGCGLG